MIIKWSRLMLTLLLFTNSAVLAQQRVIRGRVTDEANQPLPLANIGIVSNSITTMTNSLGEFTLKIPLQFQHDVITISLTGFETRTISQNDLHTDTSINQIILAKRFTELPEVVVTVPDARALIMEAIRKIPENILNDTATITSFYRELVKKGEKPIVLSEAAFELFNATNAQIKKRQIKLLQKRSVLDKKETAGLEFGMSTGSIHHFDITRELNGKGILNISDFKNYIFRYKGEGEYAGQPAIIISFDQKDGLKKALYKGTILLEKTSLAFVSFEFSNSPKGLKYAEYANGKMRLLMKLLGITVRHNGDKYKINYRKFNSRWVLSDAKTSTSLTFRSSRKQFDFECFMNGDFINTSIDTTRKSPFPAEEVLSQNRSIRFEVDEPEYVFWKDYNIILPDYDEKKIISRILTDNKAGELKELIQTQISKLPANKSLRIDSVLAFYHQNGNFNGAALIRSKDGIVVNKSYGYADAEKSIAFDNRSRFRIGSLSKSFTAVLIQQLNAEGRLKPDDSVGRFLPGYCFGNVTIAQLLTHSSGVPNFTADGATLPSSIAKKYTPAELSNRFCNDTLDFVPGTNFKYSNSGYTILAAIVEKLRGKTFGDVLHEQIFDALQMRDSEFGSDTLNTKGYLYGKPEPTYQVSNMAGGGGISSSAEDLVKWDKALSDTSLLNNQFMNDLFKPYREYRDWGAHYGYGWMIDQFLFTQSAKEIIIYHPGTDFGYYSMFARQPQKGNLVILLNNTGEFERMDITELIMNELNKK